MRRLSFTFCWPMNSASRCGRSDSSTGPSSASSSGVVTSRGDIVLRRRRSAQSNRRDTDTQQARRYGLGAGVGAGVLLSSAEDRDVDRGVQSVIRTAMIAPITTIAATGRVYLAMSSLRLTIVDARATRPEQ